MNFDWLVNAVGGGYPIFPPASFPISGTSVQYLVRHRDLRVWERAKRRNALWQSWEELSKDQKVCPCPSSIDKRISAKKSCPKSSATRGRRSNLTMNEKMFRHSILTQMILVSHPINIMRPEFYLEYPQCLSFRVLRQTSAQDKPAKKEWSQIFIITNHERFQIELKPQNR